MKPEIDFLYDFGSPNAYLVHKALPDIAARNGVKVVHVPILLGGIFKATNNQSPVSAFRDVRGKLAYQTLELKRFCRRHGIVFHWNPHFPIMTIGVMRGAIHARGKPWEGTYLDTVFDAIWIHGQKMDDPDVIADVLTRADLPAAEILAAARTDDVKQGLINTTEAAVERGAFGAPTMFLGDEMFFGKDSLPDLEWELANPEAD